MTHHQRTDLALLRETAELAIDYLTELAERPVGRPIEPDALRAALGGDLPDRGEDSERVVARLARDADPGLVATAGPRYFGFVIGGSLPRRRRRPFWRRWPARGSGRSAGCQPQRAWDSSPAGRWPTSRASRRPAMGSFTPWAMTWRRTVCLTRRRSTSSSAAKRTPRSSSRSGCWASGASGSPRCPRTDRGGCGPTPYDGPWRRAPGRRSSVPRQAT